MAKKKTAKSNKAEATLEALVPEKRPRAPSGMVTVTEEIGKAAEQKNSSHCGIAESIALVYPWATGIAVDVQTIRFSNPKKRLRYIYLTPRVAQKYIISFDQGEKTGELSFKLSRGHVIPMAGYSLETREKKLEYYRKNKDKPIFKDSQVRARQRQTFLRTKGKTGLPERFGGTAPPVAPGRRREFGLRALTK